MDYFLKESGPILLCKNFASIFFLSLLTIHSSHLYGANRAMVGDSFDFLSRAIQQSCLDPDDISIQQVKVNETKTEFFLAESRSELADKLGIEVNAEVSLSFSKFSSKVTSSTALMKSAKFSANSLVGVYRFRYKKEHEGLRYDRPKLAERWVQTLNESPKEFRYQCGDGYIDSVTMGSELYIVFNLQHKQNHDLKQLHTRNAVEAAFGSILKTSVETKVEKDSERILNNLEISIDCVSVGLPKQSCVIPIGDVTGQIDIKTIAGYIKSSNEQLLLATEDDYVAIDSHFQSYHLPMNMLGQSYHDVFFDINDYEQAIRAIILAEQKVDRHCSQRLDNIACMESTEKLSYLLGTCSDQSFWRDCPAPSELDFSFLDSLPALEIYSPGKVVLVADRKDGHIPKNSARIVLDFNNEHKFPGEKGFLEYDTLYNLKDFNFPINAATGFYSELTKDYRLCVYTDYSQRRFWKIGAYDGKWYNFTWMNDDADYFRLVKVGEYAAGC